MDEKHQNMDSKIKKKMEDAPETLTADDLNTINVFSDQIARIVEHFCKMWGAELSHQSDRSLSRTHFPQGTTANMKRLGQSFCSSLLSPHPSANICLKTERQAQL